jgi:hypothetical protein
MITDALFLKGNSHLICEDYAMYDDETIVVCDGCSSSSMVDVGARLIALEALNRKYVADIIYEIEWLNNRKYRNYPHMFDCTMLRVQRRVNTLYIDCIGDGFIIIKMLDGRIKIIELEYEHSYPYYFSYELDQTKRDASNLIAQRSPVKESYLFGDKEEIQVLPNIYSTVFDVDRVDWIGVCSDGVKSFSADNKSIHVDDVICELIDFKVFSQGFVQRRLNMFSKFCTKNRWTHYDDVSLAVMKI